MTEIAARVAPRIPSTAWMRPLPPATRLIFYGNARARALAATAWQAPFAEQALCAATHGPSATLWLGPDEYLLLAAAEDPADRVAQRLEEALAAAPHALVDISHRQTAIEVHGKHAEAILNGACPLDLDIGAFPVDMCTRTVFAKADIVLWRTAPDTFRLEIWRSFSDYVTGLLSVIARDYYPSR
ncbi:MAG: sarcosine oxidase subunit gamma [Steroidobacteraceae bacterium]|jgi:sarcosine oxidase subunit gamma